MDFKLYRTLWIIAAAFAFAAMACATSQATPTPAPTAASQPAPQEFQVALASTDIAVGTNRVAFGVLRQGAGPLTDADMSVSTFRLVNGVQEGPIETKAAIFRRWPVTAGVYTAELSFDTPGAWGLLAQFNRDGAPQSVGVGIQVKERSSTPAIGSPAPRSGSKTLADVSGLTQITTDASPDASLYQMTIAEALDAGKPLVVAFSTPAYCATSTCGPQLDVVKQLKANYGDRVNFIHIEVYDNPDEIEGDLSRARLSPTVQEWGLPSEPWTFVIDSEGNVSAKFEAFTTLEELDEAIARGVSS